MSKHLLFIPLVVIVLVSLGWKDANACNYKIETLDFISSSDTTYRIIPSIDNTYGYEILIKEKVFIRQQNIPGMSGVKGFQRKEDAEKVAKLVLKKLAEGIMPPTVEKHEMDKLKIKYY